jgi:transmembrane sensor
LRGDAGEGGSEGDLLTMARDQDQARSGEAAAAADRVVATHEMRDLWDEMGGLARSPGYAALLGRPTLRERLVEMRRAFAGSRWRFALPAVPVVAVAALGALMLLPRPLQYEAGPHARNIILPDNSSVLLAPGGRLDFAIKDGARRATLVGEATFSVARNTAHPFHVSTGDADIRVVGTRFALTYRNGCTQLAVFSGTVLMRSPSMPARRMTAGEETVAVDKGGPYTSCLRGDIDKPRLRWTYVDAPLSTVLGDVGRFYPGKIVFRSARAAGERVTISITPDQIGQMIDLLPEIADVTLTRDIEDTVGIGSRSGH